MEDDPVDGEKILGTAHALIPSHPGQIPGSHPSVRLVAEGESEAGSWLRIEPLAALMPGRWIRLWYRLSLLHDPVRPLVKVRLRSGEERRFLLPGPVLGRASWLGRIPPNAAEVLISPSVDPGPVRFTIERVEAVPITRVMAQAWSANPSRALSALGAAAIGWWPEAEEDLRWAVGRTPLDHWTVFAAERRVAPDPGGFERPLSDWQAAPKVHLVLDAEEADDAALRRTTDALVAQLYPGWTLTVGESESRRLGLQPDPRIRRAGRDDLLPAGAREDLIGTIAAGDTIETYALAAVIERAAAFPEVDGFYGDEEILMGGRVLPVLRPGWSPVRFAAVRDVGRLALLRRRRLSGVPETKSIHQRILGAFGTLGASEAVHLRRLLVRGPERQRRRICSPPAMASPNGRSPSVAVVVPTRDRAALLRRSTDGILSRTPGPLQLVVVDNGSREQAARDLLAELERHPRVTILPRPGPFNYSALCNAGAAATEADILVFLNNDVDVTSPDWLDALVGWAARPEVGAVGAKLLYPDGRLQHAGIVVGIGGEAGHFGAGLPAVHPGWRDRHLVPHEVSAVTGACLAVERRKFQAVGGFDAENLPIEFSDIDLCLKLTERGWQTIWTPAAVLVHFESASRGRATFRRLSRHGREREYFTERWAKILRDDPFYHPALSLYSLDEALA